MPLVEIPSTTSPGFPKSLSCSAKVCEKSASLLMAVRSAVSLVSARAGKARRFSMIGWTNSTATCRASHELPPFPITKSWWPETSDSATRLHTCSSMPALASKNFAFMSALSWHLRRTACLKSLEAMGDILARRPDGDQMTPVVVVGGARAFRRYHGGSQRRLRRALRPESGAIHRLLEALQHLSANADLGLARADVFDLRDAVGIVFAEGV